MVDGRSPHTVVDSTAGEPLMSFRVYRINALLSSLLSALPIGTNLALFHMIWTLLSGRLLASRGAISGALDDARLPKEAVRRSMAALAYGRWEIAPLVAAFARTAETEGGWYPHSHDGYHPVACDLVGFFRPRLHGCPTKHYSPAAGRSLPAIPLGVAVRVGSLIGQRVPVPLLILRADPADPRESTLQRTLVRRVGALLCAGEVFVADGGFHVPEMLDEQVPRFLVRGAVNLTARRNFLPAPKQRGRPCEYGELVRPLPRSYEGKEIAATEPDWEEVWVENGILLRAQFFFDLVPSDRKPGGPSFAVVVVFDPRYEKPLVEATNLVGRPTAQDPAAPASPAAAVVCRLAGSKVVGEEPARSHPVVWRRPGEPSAVRGASGQGCYRLYKDRWPVEQVPQAGKQLLGAGRQFVSGEESRQRLPELALWAGAVLMYEAAGQPAIATGFWDRRPQGTIGRLRRALARTDYSDWVPQREEIRKKASPTAHLPKGVRGHRRHERDEIPEQRLRKAA
jgi:hypothetical protein